ncbi:MAG: hypothetical protein Kow0010_16400 [Dehalococcoidia bacterium]
MAVIGYNREGANPTWSIGLRTTCSTLTASSCGALEGDNHWLLFDDPGAPGFVRAIDEFTRVDGTGEVGGRA